MDEQSLIREYMDLLGTTESAARAVFMYLFTSTAGLVRGSSPGQQVSTSEVDSRSLPPGGKFTGVICWLALTMLLSSTAVQSAQGQIPNTATNLLPVRPLSLADAINIALQQSPDLQRAQKNLESTRGIVIQTRAIALPHLGVTGNYTAVQPSDVDTPDIPGIPFTFGTDQSWRTQVRVVQSLYEGGRVLSSLRAAKLLDQQALLNYQVAVADTVLQAQRAYYAVLLATQQISVQEASVELLSRELADTRRRFEAGTVPRFNVLRAEVEVANAKPRLSRARNSLRISKNQLANVLGFNLATNTPEDIPLNLSGSLDVEPVNIDLARALALAFRQRSELESLRKTRSLRQEDVISAKAGYKPSLQAFGGYDFHSSMFTPDLTEDVHGWMAGVQMSWDIFDGLRTAGRVKQARAQYELAGIELADAGRRIELEVRTAFSSFVEATEVLESQTKVQEQAQEALRLATARSEAGTGTQLDVLSAQTALTEARTTMVQAKHDYAVARAGLERAMGMNLPQQSGFQE